MADQAAVLQPRTYIPDLTWLTTAARRQILPAAALLGLALAMRWPYLLDWPAFTDETREVLLSLAVARGERWPWTGVNQYIGPWHVYLLAGIFWLGGVHPATGRLVAPLRDCARVVIDQELNFTRLEGGGTLLRATRFALSMHAAPWRTAARPRQPGRER